MRALLVLVALLLAPSVAVADLAPPQAVNQGDDNCTVERACPGGISCEVLHYQVDPSCAARAKAKGMAQRCISGGRNGGSAVYCPTKAPAPSATTTTKAPAAPSKAHAPAPTVPPTTSHGCGGCAMSTRRVPLGALLLAGLCGLFALRRRD